MKSMKLNRSFPIKVSHHDQAVNLHVPVRGQAFWSEKNSPYKVCGRNTLTSRLFVFLLVMCSSCYRGGAHPVRHKWNEKKPGWWRKKEVEHNRLFILFQINLHPFDKQWHVSEALLLLMEPVCICSENSQQNIILIVSLWFSLIVVGFLKKCF